jgi:hypothetical protein
MVVLSCAHRVVVESGLVGPVATVGDNVAVAGRWTGAFTA